jgi:hypothetical protein
VSKALVVVAALCAVLGFGERAALAQGRDSVVNGIVIGAAIGAGTGVAFTHAVRDSDLTAGQYARGALVFGALGAGAGLGVDAWLNRASSIPLAAPRRLTIAPAFWRNVSGVLVRWKW